MYQNVGSWHLGTYKFQSAHHCVVSYDFSPARVVLMFIGAYNNTNFKLWICGCVVVICPLRVWSIKLLELCIPTFPDMVTRHYQQECVLIVFGHSCLEDVDTRSSLCSFLFFFCLRQFVWIVLKLKYFNLIFSYVHITILRSHESSSISLRYVSLLWQFVSVYEKLGSIWVVHLWLS